MMRKHAIAVCVAIALILLSAQSGCVHTNATKSSASRYCLLKYRIPTHYDGTQINLAEGELLIEVDADRSPENAAWWGRMATYSGKGSYEFWRQFYIANCATSLFDDEDDDDLTGWDYTDQWTRFFTSGGVASIFVSSFTAHEDKNIFVFDLRHGEIDNSWWLLVPWNLVMESTVITHNNSLEIY